MKQRIRRILIVTSLGFGVAYPLYCGAAQAGLLGWLVDLELALQGRGPYVVRADWLLILTCLISWIIPAALCLFGLYMIDQLLPPPAAIIEAPRLMTEAPTPAPEASNWARNPVIIFLLVGSMVLIVVGVRAGVIAYRISSEAVTSEALNLADGAPPSSKHVKLTGLAVPSLKSQYTITYRSYPHLETYIPVVPPHWRQGEAVVYFLHQDSVGHTEPVMIRQTGVLMRDALPGAAVFLCKKHGITLGTPTFVLEDDAQAEADPYIYTAVLCSIVGLAFFLPLAPSWVGELLRRRKLPS